MKTVLGFDTSNYTTSAAVFRADGTGCNEGRLLDVPEGGLGLRQSDALFQHVRRLPERVDALLGAGKLPALSELAAVGASTAPRAVEGSYMPCFLAGTSQARVLADVLGVPFFGCSHQQGHVAAASWSAGHPELLDAPFLSWHLSGGTTELLLTEPVDGMPHMTILGATEDISAGQLIDRTGKLLGIPFPAGKALDALAAESDSTDGFPVKLRELSFSLSGVENQVKQNLTLSAVGHSARQAQSLPQRTVRALGKNPEQRHVFLQISCRQCGYHTGIQQQQHARRAVRRKKAHCSG